MKNIEDFILSVDFMLDFTDYLYNESLRALNIVGMLWHGIPVAITN